MKKTFRLEGLNCANCAAKTEKQIKALAGVTSDSVNYTTAKLVIEAADDKMTVVVSAAEKIVKKN